MAICPHCGEHVKVVAFDVGSVTITNVELGVLDPSDKPPRGLRMLDRDGKLKGHFLFVQGSEK